MGRRIITKKDVLKFQTSQEEARKAIMPSLEMYFHCRNCMTNGDDSVLAAGLLDCHTIQIVCETCGTPVLTIDLEDTEELKERMKNMKCERCQCEQCDTDEQCECDK